MTSCVVECVRDGDDGNLEVVYTLHSEFDLSFLYSGVCVSCLHICIVASEL